MAYRLYMGAKTGIEERPIAILAPNDAAALAEAKKFLDDHVLCERKLASQ